jgi:hypothetical protein
MISQEEFVELYVKNECLVGRVYAPTRTLLFTSKEDLESYFVKQSNEISFFHCPYESENFLTRLTIWRLLVTDKISIVTAPMDLKETILNIWLELYKIEMYDTRL